MQHEKASSATGNTNLGLYYLIANQGCSVNAPTPDYPAVVPLRAQHHYKQQAQESTTASEKWAMLFYFLSQECQTHLDLDVAL